MGAPSLSTLYGRLKSDRWREEHSFSEDVEKLHRILFHPYKSHALREEAYLLWLMKNQPCMFGRIAAAKQRIHFCLLGDEDLRESDSAIGERIQHERKLWKQRSVHPIQGISDPAHGFMLIAFSSKLALAAPDENLRAFSEKLLSLWNAESHDSPSGQVNSETLFLKKPDEESTYVRFKFSIDFFMAQGDGRWWHDHRIPGGIAFTANSAGHMRRYREWYEKMSGQEEWVLQTAMLTIAAAAETPHGKATWLSSLTNGKPFVAGLKCPFSNPEKVKPEIQGKDWTRYFGHLHTDHAIRDEFFHPNAEKPAEVRRNAYAEDFTYLYDPRQTDHINFIAGTPVSEKEVHEQIGCPEEYVQVTPERQKTTPTSVKLESINMEEQSTRNELERLVNEIRHWNVQPTDHA